MTCPSCVGLNRPWKKNYRARITKKYIKRHQSTCFTSKMREKCLLLWEVGVMTVSVFEISHSHIVVYTTRYAFIYYICLVKIMSELKNDTQNTKCRRWYTKQFQPVRHQHTQNKQQVTKTFKTAINIWYQNPYSFFKIPDVRNSLAIQALFQRTPKPGGDIGS